MLGTLYADLPYGVGIADWDAAAPTEDQLKTLLEGFMFLKGNKALVTVVLWCSAYELGLVRKVLTEMNFKHIQLLTWYKHNSNHMSGPAMSFLHATEVCIIAYAGKMESAPEFLNMPSDPLKRHNIIIGPRMGKKSVDVEGKEVNPCEKPDYLSEWILRKVTKPGDTVLVAGFGAGGDMRGAINAGCNVIGIEQDKRQFNAVTRTIGFFKPKSNMSLVVSPAELLFGHDCLEVLGAYRDEVSGDSFDCTLCGKKWPGDGLECPKCQDRFCVNCLPDPNVPCQQCKPVPAVPQLTFVEEVEQPHPRPLQWPLRKRPRSRESNVLARFWVRLHHFFRCFYWFSCPILFLKNLPK
jgi:hypothetical protein